MPGGCGRGLVLLLVLLLSGLFPLPGQAQSLAARLSEYQAALRVASVAGVTAKSFSGVAFHPGTRTLYVVDNDNAIVYELDTAGVLRRTLATSGFTDPEGIAYQSDDFFLISEEGLADIVRLKLPRTGTGPAPRSGGSVLSLGSNMANSGIEGVAYRAADRTAFAIKEIDPPRMYRIALDASGVPTTAFPGEPFDIGNKSGDVADIAALEDGNFILVNQEQDRLEGYDAQGKALGNLTLGMSKPEGIAIDSATGTIYVVGEPAEFAVFRRKGSAVREVGDAGDAGDAGQADADFTVSDSPDGLEGGSGAGRRIGLILHGSAFVRVSILAANGAWTEVREGRLGPGFHDIVLGGLPAGVGFCRIAAGSRERIVKVVSF
jgi:uncharacterized protein YjiK